MNWRRHWSVARQVGLYGAALAGGTLALDWFDVQRAARLHKGGVYLFLLAAGFLLLGLWAGARLFGATPPPPNGNPAAQATLGISARELQVLHALAAGRSNKEIASELRVSPNTIKTHVARLFTKLEARRRTDALAKARALGLLP